MLAIFKLLYNVQWMYINKYACRGGDGGGGADFYYLDEDISPFHFITIDYGSCHYLWEAFGLCESGCFQPFLH